MTTPQDRALMRLREHAAGILDAFGLALLAWLAYWAMFRQGYLFESKALLVGAVGVVSRWCVQAPRVRVPTAMVMYVVVANISAVVHQWGRVTEWSQWPTLFAPATHLIVMLIFVVGVAHLLRTRRRLAVFLSGLCAAALVLSIQTLFDQSVNGFHFQPGLQVQVPSVAQWGGLHDLSLASCMAVPIVLAPAMIARTWRLMVAGSVLAGLPLLAALALGARSQVVVVAPVILAMLAVAAVGPAMIARHRYAIPIVGAAALAVCLLIMVWKGLLTAELVRNMSGRTGIWQATLRLIVEQPWLGVGPGEYAQALAARDLGKYIIGPGSAHNLLLHIAAEVGVVGAALWVALVFTMMKGSWRVAMRGTARILGAAVFFMLTVMVVQWTVESFIEGSFFVERHRILAWSVFAAALAVERAGQAASVPNVALS